MLLERVDLSRKSQHDEMMLVFQQKTMESRIVGWNIGID